MRAEQVRGETKDRPQILTRAVDFMLQLSQRQHHDWLKRSAKMSDYKCVLAIVFMYSYKMSPSSHSGLYHIIFACFHLVQCDDCVVLFFRAFLLTTQLESGNWRKRSTAWCLNSRTTL